MPPAFVLSQDQTLRKTKICLTGVIRFKAIWFKTFTSQEILRFTSHYSIFNQLIALKRRQVLNISSIFIFASSKSNFFKNFSIRLFNNPHLFQRNSFLIYHRFLTLQAKIWFFSKLFHLLLSSEDLSSNPVANPHQAQQNHNIHHQLYFASDFHLKFTLFSHF